MDLKRRWAEQLADHRIDSLIHRLAPFALMRPAFTVNNAMAEIGGTFASVNNAAARLVEKRIRVIAKGSPRDRLFQVPEVLDAFEHFRTRRGHQDEETPLRERLAEGAQREPPTFRGPPSPIPPASAGRSEISL